MAWQKVLITGGGGFIGSHLVHYLSDNFNGALKILELPSTNLEHLQLENSNIEIIRGDITNLETVKHASKACDLIIHLAAIAKLWHPNPEVFNQVNYLGTKNLLHAAKLNQIKRFVHISTEMILLLAAQNLKILTEQTKVPLANMLGPYCISKWRAEQAVLTANTTELNTIIVTPAVPIGANDYNLGPVSALIKNFIAGKIKAYMPGGIHLIDVNDVAKGIWAAANNSSKQNKFLLTNEYWSIYKLLQALSKITNTKMPKFKIPVWLGLAFAKLEEKICKFTNQPPMATTAGIHAASCKATIDANQTLTNLQLNLQPCEPALTAMVHWLKSNHLDIAI